MNSQHEHMKCVVYVTSILIFIFELQAGKVSHWDETKNKKYIKYEKQSSQESLLLKIIIIFFDFYSSASVLISWCVYVNTVSKDLLPPCGETWFLCNMDSAH